MSTKKTTVSNNYVKDMCNAIMSVSDRYQTYEVFEDLLLCAACSISNSIDKQNFEEREKMYLQAIKKYDKQEADRLVSAFSLLVEILDSLFKTKGYVDVLGEVFHALNLQNKYAGQFFTPFHICELMGMITIGGTESTESVEKEINEKGYVTVSEPTVGSGGMVLGFAKAMSDCKFDPQTQMLATCVDIDIKCVCMTYIQLSLFGLPAIVFHGDTILNKMWSAWYTPGYAINQSKFVEERRENHGN